MTHDGHFRLPLQLHVRKHGIEDLPQDVLLVILTHVQRYAALLFLYLTNVSPVSDHLRQSPTPIDFKGSCLSLFRFSKQWHHVSPLFEDILCKCSTANSCLHLASQSVVVTCVQLQECLLELKQVFRALLLELLYDSHYLFFLLLLLDHVLQHHREAFSLSQSLRDCAYGSQHCSLQLSIRPLSEGTLFKFRVQLGSEIVCFGYQIHLFLAKLLQLHEARVDPPLYDNFI